MYEYKMPHPSCIAKTHMEAELLTLFQELFDLSER